MKKILLMMAAMFLLLGSIVLAENETTNSTTNSTLNVTYDETTNSTMNTTANVTTNETTNSTVNNTANVTTNTTSNITTNVTANTTSNTTANTTANTTTNVTVNNTYGAGIAKALNVRYEHLICKVELTNEQIDIFEEYVPELNLSDNKAELIADLNKLKDLKNKTNKTEFDRYLVEVFKPNFLEATRELNAAKKNFRQYNFTNETKEDIIDDLKDLREEYADCISDKERKMAKVAYEHYKNLDDNWYKKIDKMSRNGLNTTELEALKDEIEARNAKLQELIESGDTKAVKAYLKELREESLHAAALFEVERLKSYNHKLKSEARKSGVDRSFEDIDDEIENAQRIIDRRQKYEDNEREETWKSIKEANKDMKEISKDILKERRNREKEDRKDMRRNNSYNDSDDDSDDDSREDSDEDDDDSDEDD